MLLSGSGILKSGVAQVSLVSLREGVASRVLGDREDLRRRIMNDRAEDGLTQGIHRVLQPVFAGTMVPDVGAQCKDCRLVRVCRVPKSRPRPMGNGEENRAVEGDATVLLDRMWDAAQVEGAERKPVDAG